MPFSRGSSQPRDQTRLSYISCIGRWVLYHSGVSLVDLTVKSLSAMQETWVRSPGREDHLEEGMATHSSILAWRISWTEEPGSL